MVNFTLNPNETKRPIGAVDPDVDPLIHPELYIGLIFKRVAAYIIDALIISVIVGFVWVGLGILGIVTLGLTFGLMGIVIFIIPLDSDVYFFKEMMHLKNKENYFDGIQMYVLPVEKK